MFRPTQDRIRAIALVHEQLDNSARFDAIGLSGYLEHLLTHLQISHREYQVAVEVDIDADIAIKLESATHVGLLVHELVLCSYRYSFAEKTAGTIWFTARADGDQLILSIRDSGMGMPAELDPQSPDQDEIAIVSGLVRRLSCELTLDRSAGAGWSVRIPLESVQHRSEKPVGAESV
jgi:two-component sensor histidine kinase